ncbi:MAG: hypothetical protein MI923_28745 [Phycisphaerales bacterium]|nr:hypothetical protein [Phycisphaerales bacterium]
MKSIAKFRFAIAVIALTLAVSSPASAQFQVEPIGPFDLFANEEIGFGPFDNDITNPPLQKILIFEGTAQNPSPFFNRLSVFFDYVDPVLGEVFVGDVLTNITLLEPDGDSPLTDQPVFASWTLDFCPSQVGVHFFAPDLDVINIQGEFKHICIPEPGSAVLLAFGFVVVTLSRRTRG